METYRNKDSKMLVRAGSANNFEAGRIKSLVSVRASFAHRVRLGLLLVTIGVISASGMVYPTTGGTRRQSPSRPSPSSSTPANPHGGTKVAARNFITRSGDRLMDGTIPFNFVSYSAPTLLVNEVVWPLRNDDAATIEGQNFEREDLMKSLAQIAGGVTRTFVISTQGEFPGQCGCPRSPTCNDRRKHVTWDCNGNIQFDQEMFRGMDRTLELANQLGLRVIVPLLWASDKDGDVEVWGGAVGYSRAKGGRNFWTDRIVKDEFQKTIRFVLNRVNERTGVKYLDDPAILAWETGNELDKDPQEWTEEMARFIKDIDRNHLVMDGHYGIRDSSLNSSAIDIVSNHYYAGHLNADDVLEDRRRSRGRKPFIVGEFGTNQGGDVTRIRDLLNAVVSSGVAGALLWDIKPHSRFGGFPGFCDDPISDLACSYHWPGFPRGHSPRYQQPDEKQILSLVVEAANRIRGLPPGRDGRIGVPDPPKLASVEQGGDFDLNGRWIGANFQLRWRGSAGADAYVIERAPSETGPWTLLSTDASDNKPPTIPLYNDGRLPVGQRFWYRVSAEFIRSNGTRDVSAPSNALQSPVTNCGGRWLDTDINVCGEGGMDLPYSSNPFSCGQTVIDPCGVAHTCSPCQPTSPCGSDPVCPDGSCPSDHGGVCPEAPCPRQTPVRCSDGSCVKSAVFCPTQTEFAKAQPTEARGRLSIKRGPGLVPPRINPPSRTRAGLSGRRLQTGRLRHRAKSVKRLPATTERD